MSVLNPVITIEKRREMAESGKNAFNEIITAGGARSIKISWSSLWKYQILSFSSRLTREHRKLKNYRALTLFMA
jgi:hypothetical protein